MIDLTKFNLEPLYQNNVKVGYILVDKRPEEPAISVDIEPKQPAICVDERNELEESK